ncbi:MAG TPA: radical SAM-associated putative lipoprotein [Bacteroidales bacterium]|nr:radical SAM-associated putative lipoprotein [Bacteroidales bacterium]
MPPNFRNKRLKVKAFYLKYLLRLMGLAGFGMLVSCTKYGAPIAEYGVLADNVNFHGTVLSEDSLKPIKNIQVKLAFQASDTLTAQTDPQGNYSIPHYVNEGQSGALIFTDRDSTLNGSFYAKSATFVISASDISTMEHETDVLLERNP